MLESLGNNAEYSTVLAIATPPKASCKNYKYATASPKYLFSEINLR